jgi:YidC/Oxa1 family membrane protein insertase
VIPFAILGPIERILTDLLEWFHGTVGLTWAVSIIALTVLVRIVMVPLTVRQIHSMQKLQMIAPELKAIQQKYKNDKQRQQQEVMAFYKENKVNPAASCLPVLLQIPIFISLFFVLRDFEKEVFPQYPGSDLGFLHVVRPLRREPAALDAPDADRRPDAAGDLHRPAVRLHLLRHQLPGRLDALLGDDEPVDDRAGARHAAADAATRDAGQAELEDAAQGGAAKG